MLNFVPINTSIEFWGSRLYINPSVFLPSLFLAGFHLHFARTALKNSSERFRLSAVSTLLVMSFNDTYMV